MSFYGGSAGTRSPTFYRLTFYIRWHLRCDLRCDFLYTLRLTLRCDCSYFRFSMLVARNPPQPPRVQDTRHGTQRRRASLSRRTPRGEVLFGPELPPRAPRRPPNAITINGESLTARQALERYPQLREFLQQGRRISEKSLQAKVRTWIRKGKIPNNVFNPEPEIVPRERLLGNNVIGVNPATGEATAEEQSCFNSRQESIFESTDLEEVYERMVAKMLEAFTTYLRNGSGWVLKKVVRQVITLSRLRPLRGSFYIPLPKRILKRKALINMENDDEECFKWAVTRALNPVEKNPQRVTKELIK